MAKTASSGMVGLTIRIAPEDIPELLETLRGSGEMSQRINVTLADTDETLNTEIRTSARVGRRTTTDRDADDIAAPRIPAVVYAFSRKRSAREIQSMNLPNQQRIILAYVIKHGPSSAREIESGTGLKQKSVQSAVYQLRHTRPALLVSQTAESDERAGVTALQS